MAGSLDLEGHLRHLKLILDGRSVALSTLKNSKVQRPACLVTTDADNLLWRFWEIEHHSRKRS